MARVAVIERTGGPEVIQWVDRELPPPGPGEVRVRHAAVGLNFIDTYHRSGLYPVPLPSGLGTEAAGEVTAVGDGAGFAVGDRVTMFGLPLGAYATERNVAASSLFRLPDGIDYDMAAAVTLKGATAEFLIERCARVEPGMTVLVHAAAGGVGQLLVQWLKHVGASVIGTVGSGAKAEQVRAMGADHVVEYRKDDIAERVHAITGGKGANVVIDGVGGSTWAASLKSTARLNQHGSLFVTRPTLFHYYVTPEERAAGMARVFELVGSGVLKVEIGQRFALEDAAAAHRAIVAGETVGSTLLVP